MEVDERLKCLEAEKNQAKEELSTLQGNYYFGFLVKIRYCFFFLYILICRSLITIMGVEVALMLIFRIFVVDCALYLVSTSMPASLILKTLLSLI